MNTLMLLIPPHEKDATAIERAFEDLETPPALQGVHQFLQRLRAMTYLSSGTIAQSKPNAQPGIVLDATGFNFIKDQLDALRISAEEDEYGPLKPAPFASISAEKILADAYSEWTTRSIREHMNAAFPRAAVSTSDTSGIRIEWMVSQRIVRLVIFPNNPDESYIYYDFGDGQSDYGIIERPDGRHLATFLRKLL